MLLLRNSNFAHGFGNAIGIFLGLIGMIASVFDFEMWTFVQLKPQIM